MLPELVRGVPSSCLHDRPRFIPFHIHGFPCAIFQIILYSAIFFTFVPSSKAANDLAGTTTAGFLKIGTHAQAVGLGEAVTALADGIAFIGYNPAAVQLRSLTLAATHTAMYDGVNLEEVALGIPFRKDGGMFIRGNGILFDKTDRTDINGDKTGTFDASAFSAGVGFYANLGNLTLGVFGKSIQQKIDVYKSSTLAGDIGIRYLTPMPGISLGVAAVNIGRPAKFIAQEDELPRAIRAGIGYDNGFLKLAVDGVQYIDQKSFLAGGAELTLFGGLRVRAGYSANSELNSPFKAGLGLKFSSLEFNYAYNPGDDFGAAHRVSLTIR